MNQSESHTNLRGSFTQRSLPYCLSAVVVLGIACLIVTVSSNALSAKGIDEIALRELEQSVQSVVAKVMPATVGIGSKNGPPGGSGVVVSKDGLILTAAHVVAATGEDLVIYFPNGRRVKAKKLGADNDADAAMVQIEEAGEFPFVEIGNSGKLSRNQWMVAIGHAGGFQSDRTPPVRLGRMLGRNDEGFITTDCALIGGDSGGPLFDIDGKLIGIHSNIGNSLATNNHVPVKEFQDGWKRMRDGESWGSRFGGRSRPNPDEAVLGIMPRDEQDSELIELRVLPGSPADTAGVASGDVLLKIDGKKLSSYATVRRVMVQKKPGDEVALTVSRDGEETDINVTVLRREEVMRSVREALEKDGLAHSTEDDAPPTNAEMDLLLRALIDQAKEGDGRLELEPEQIQEFGGLRRFMQRLRKLLEPDEIAKLIGEDRPRDDNHLRAVLTTFRNIVHDASLSVVPIMHDGRQVALGTAVHENGYLITKASEIDDGELVANVDELTQSPVQLVREFPEFDLAIVKVDAQLVPVKWYTPSENPLLGSLVAAAGINDQPLAVGVMSVGERNLSGSDKGFLGVALMPGIIVMRVEKSSPAAEAGLKAGDTITKVDDQKMENVRAFVENIKNRTPGETIQLEFERDGKTKTAKVTLTDRVAMPMIDGTGRYPTGGELSEQRGGYPSAIQTDLPVRPEDCGSPLVDLDGRVLGINIARAGRIKSYAISTQTILKLLDGVKFD